MNPFSIKGGRGVTSLLFSVFNDPFVIENFSSIGEYSAAKSVGQLRSFVIFECFLQEGSNAFSLPSFQP